MAACETPSVKSDVALHFQNTTTETVDLSVREVSGSVQWEKVIPPGESQLILFNIKNDLNKSEGGFIYKATFSTGETFELNTGYFTNSQFQQKNPSFIKIGKSEFVIN